MYPLKQFPDLNFYNKLTSKPSGNVTTVVIAWWGLRSTHIEKYIVFIFCFIVTQRGFVFVVLVCV
jgi:hypothetical protein